MNNDEFVRFENLNLIPDLQKVIKELGYETPTPIQAQTIPHLLEGRDLLGQAQTGTGKTAAFALPLLSRLDLRIKEPQILVLTPTRELSLQVAEAIRTYARHLKGFHVLPVYGGQNMGHQLRQLKRGVHVVVGTPGRIQDHLERKTLGLHKLKTVVLDEADEMLKMGFVDDVEQILSHAPQIRQTALFSATMPTDVLKVARRHMVDPVEIFIKTKTSTVETVNQRYWQVKGLHKLDALTRILEAEDTDGMIIFVRTKTATVELSEKLEARGFSSAALNGDMTQPMREKTVEKLKNGQLDIIVATDVAARGLDVKRISHVINYDIPYDTESYVHRIGRTGRAGRTGQAILFVAPREKRMLSSIERATRQPITAMSVPSRKAISDRRVTLFNEQLTEAMQSEELEFFEELIDNYQHEHNTGLRKIASTLAYLLQKDKPLQSGNELESEVQDFEKETECQPELQPYRVEVGRQHGVEPRHLVGAIANEARINSKSIGQISINKDYCLIDLPANLPEQIMKKLENVWVCGQKLQISIATSDKEMRSNRKTKHRVVHKRIKRNLQKKIKKSRNPSK
jgi:ATP-dependent RNA helicase DeaD